MAFTALLLVVMLMQNTIIVASVHDESADLILPEISDSSEVQLESFDDENAHQVAPLAVETQTDATEEETENGDDLASNDCGSATSQEDCAGTLSACKWKPLTGNCVSASLGGNDGKSLDIRLSWLFSFGPVLGDDHIFRHGAGVAKVTKDYSTKTCTEKCTFVSMGEGNPEVVELLKAKGWEFFSLRKIVNQDCNHCTEFYASYCVNHTVPACNNTNTSIMVDN